ncbi:TetR/AcrR family transcriptional regulator [Marinobacterium mangrovicola]|uniref:TetR family transcriptional regulator n=1 Tax=Marinobacterium mangrovicola TaxID=1476959 RepID=A0A4R1GBX6_9GAMM|nr:TetR/AcrR family transcriptional regulator [Marinobacterium mangrovicola]TCK04303.1 TetR family transcriptional regulator [Marinobacterium mangrovicola]
MNSACLRIHHAAMKIFAEMGGTSLTVSDVAREAGLSRGTVYNNLQYPESMFDSVCEMIGKELDESFGQVTADMKDPAEKISAAIRLSLRRTHEEPDWGRFLARYAIIDPKIGAFWGRMPAAELRRGVESGRFSFEMKQLASVAATVGGSTLGAMSLVLDGHRTWRQAGSETAEIVLRGIGIDPAEAKQIAEKELAPLPRLSVFDPYAK